MSRFKIVPLSEKNLAQTCALTTKVFPEVIESDVDYPPRWFTASLFPKKHKEVFASLGAVTAHYWVAEDSATKKVIGTTGIYFLEKDSTEAAWLGWFCVDPAYRRQGVGNELLEFIKKKAKKLKKKYLRLYTSTEGEDALAFYDAAGFHTFKTEAITGHNPYTRHYKELTL